MKGSNLNTPMPTHLSDLLAIFLILALILTGCALTGCSESQVFSVYDAFTNYCNSHNLFCSDAGCHPFTKLTYKETVKSCSGSSPFSGKPNAAKDCYFTR